MQRIQRVAADGDFWRCFSCHTPEGREEGTGNGSGNGPPLYLSQTPGDAKGRCRMRLRVGGVRTWKADSAKA